MNAPACVVDELGIFVDGDGGDDARAGTRLAPLKTINAALGKLAGRPRIYICGDGRYEERVRLDDRVSPSLHGGFACADWKYVGSRPALAPASAGYVLQIVGTRNEVTVSDIALTAIDGPIAGASSVGVFASSSPTLTLRRVVITTGAGVAGNAGTSTAEYTTIAPTGKSGAQGGLSVANPRCPASIGGGRAGAIISSGLPLVTPGHPTAQFNGAGGFVGDLNCGPGNPGSYGAGGTGGAGASMVGALDENGWHEADGTQGVDGASGQGGGPGGAPSHIDPGSSTPIPGGGGAGGCGGRGGAFGRGGGSSIAVLALNTPVSLDRARLIASAGGAGGTGAQGQRGELASLQSAFGAETGCSGGLGGIGGGGGGGGGGAGGISVGVLYRGAAPVIDGALAENADSAPSITIGMPGAGGAGGAAAAPAISSGPPGRGGEKGIDGVAGFAKAVSAIP